MADARTATLDRIRKGLGNGDTGHADPAAEYAALPRGYIRAGRLDPEGRLHLFLERLRDYETQVVETSAAGVAETIAGVLRGHGQKRVMAADGLPANLLPREFTFLAESEAGAEELNDCDGVITACTAAIAFTGSIVLTHGPGEGARRLTLVPDRHLCVVHAEQVVETVPEAFGRLAPNATRPLTFISGPSATADIEMTRIRGVHGPRFLDIVLVR
jgi:L-lactate dehydrogenase complex protein LldG